MTTTIDNYQAIQNQLDTAIAAQRYAIRRGDPDLQVQAEKVVGKAAQILGLRKSDLVVRISRYIASSPNAEEQKQAAQTINDLF